MCDHPCNPVREAIEEHRALLAEKFGVKIGEDDYERGAMLEALMCLEAGNDAEAVRVLERRLAAPCDLLAPRPQAMFQALNWLSQHAPSRAAETIKHALTIK